jgi:hypothetical protein
MRATVTLPILVVASALTLQAGPIVQYQVTTVGTTSTGLTQYRYNYQLSGFTLFVNEEIDIRFDPTLFDEIFNGVAGPGFDLLLFQPNQPPGVPGDYSALAGLNASLSGTFSVDFTLAPNVTLTANDPRLAQPFFLFDDNPGTSLHPELPFQGVVSPASPAQNGSAPEPNSIWLCGIGMFVCGVGWVVRRNTRNRGLTA